LISISFILFLLTFYFINKKGGKFNFTDITDLKPAKVADYYPINKNTRYIYKIAGDDFNTS